MPLVIGPKRGELGVAILEALKKNETARKAKHDAKPTEVQPKTPTRYKASGNKQLENMKKKKISEYGPHEMWYVFKNAWMSMWQGSPKNWSGREYKMVKDMLKQYSPEDVVGVIQYSVENWASIRVRHRIASYPTFFMIYGLRDQLLAEYFNGVLSPMVGEYSREKADKIADGEWGC